MTRYAIYFTPPEHGPLWRLGSAVLGYDAATGLDAAHPDDPLFHDPAMLAFTAEPRRYGFHATLKAPFMLAEGRTPDELAARLEAFALRQQSFAIDLDLVVLDTFLALMPREPSTVLQRLADDCVRAFDDFRAPLTAADRARRRPERLSPRQRDHLDAWGYPFVFSEFRFHMTLTGRLDPPGLRRFEPVLRRLFRLVPQPTAIDAVALFRQDGPQSRFSLVRRFAFPV